MRTPPRSFDSFDAFWLHYLQVHSKQRTRQMHYLAITVGIVGILVSTGVADYGLFAIGGIVAGYLIAWSAHATIEHNSPAFFGAPIWSLGAGLRMYVLGTTGRLGPHLARAGVAENAPAAPRQADKRL